MKSTKCVFCQIVKGRLPAYKVYEDKKYIAFLDIFPNIRGQTLVVPKRHMVSLFSLIGDKELASFMLVTKKVANQIRKNLRVARVHVALEGTGVNHLHARLYPSSGLTSSEFKEAIAAERVYFKKYPGYMTTMLGPKASNSALKKVQKEIAR